MRRKKLGAWLLTVALVLGMLPAPAMAAGPEDETGYCPHHTEHTVECGYIAPTGAAPCRHEHTAECWQEETVCVHTHTEDCYSDGVLPIEGEEKDADACVHVCTEKSGCVTPVPDCRHEHDGACGYAPADPGQPCGYVCRVCPVQALLDALPDAENIAAENRAEVEAQLSAIDGARAGLSDEEADQLDTARYQAAVSALLALDGQAGADVPVPAEALTPGAEHDISTGPAVISQDGSYIITGETTQNSIQVAQGITATITLKDVSINVRDLPASEGDSGEGVAAFRIGGKNDDVSQSSNITVMLEGNNSLSSGGKYAGLQIRNNDTLKITGSGTLTAASRTWAAAIGGGYGSQVDGDADNCSSGTIIIEDTTINATAGGIDNDAHGGAGIGSGRGGTSGPITITNSNIKATGGGGSQDGVFRGGAGIGSGSNSGCGNISISGSSVEATGSLSGAGIGSGTQDGCSGSIVISDSSIKAYPGDKAHSAIGPGDGFAGSSGTIKIENSTVIADGKEPSSADLKTGRGTIGTNLVEGRVDSITITNSLVSVHGPSNHYIKGKNDTAFSNSLILHNVPNESTVYKPKVTLVGNVTLNRDITIPASYEGLELSDNANLTIGSASQPGSPTVEIAGAEEYFVSEFLPITNYGVLINRSEIKGDVNGTGTVINYGTLSGAVSCTVNVSVALDARDGNSPGDGPQDSVLVTYQQKYGDLPTPTRNGHTFDGWYTAADGGTEVTSADTVSNPSAHTLYAHWTENKSAVTVTFSDNPAYNGQLTITAAIGEAPGNVLFRAALNTVDFYLGDVTEDNKLNTDAVPVNDNTNTATLTVDLTGERWTPGEKTITAVFGGSALYTDSTGSGTVMIAAQREPTPSAGISCIDETLTGLTAGASYSITPAGGAAVEVTAEGGTAAIPEDWFGQTLSIVKKAQDGNYSDSEAQSLPIPARPDAPSAPLTLTKTADSITITCSGCEFSADGTDWQDSGAFTGLTAETEYPIQARVKATAGSFKSAPMTQTVTTAAADGSATVKPGETVTTGGVTITNDGNKTTIKSGETTTTVTPGNSVTVNADGGVTVPGGSTVQTGSGPEITVGPGNGGTVGSDGGVTVPGGGSVQVGETTITVPNGGGIIRPNPDGTIPLPGGAVVEQGGTVSTVPETGGTYNPSTGTLTDNVHTVTFDSQGGSAVSPVTVTHGGTAAKPGAPTRSGYSFSGWYKDSDCTTAWNFDADIVTGDITLYAKWTAQSTGGGSGGGGGSYTPPTYPPTVEKPSAGGTVTVSPSRPGTGDKVTIRPQPDSGYEVDKVTVTDKNGRPVAVTKNPDGTYSFTQPSDTVKVEVSYKTAETKPADIPWSSPFRDVAENAWYSEAVRYVSDHGLMDGYSSGQFGPNDNLTRAQLAQILHSKEGKPGVNYLMQFGDVTGGAWYTEAVRWAAAQGIVGGYEDGRFGPNDNITREQLAVMLWRYAGSPAAAEELRFSDAEQISRYALDAMRWAVENGIMSGYDNGQLGPRGLATRAQIAQMLMNFFEKR